jgi:hypothetical protein
MNDVKDVLERALDQLPPAGAVTDPAPDLARGRSLLRRRRRIRAAGVAGACAAVAAIALVPALSGGQPATHPPAALKTASRASYGNAIKVIPGRLAVGLVAYPGPQPPGYTVKEIPKGWVIQGSNSYVLTIAPANDSDKSADSFIGKLVVMWEQDYTPGSSTRVTVAGRPGYFSVQGNTQMLAWNDPKGRWLVVQAPTSLGWNESELAAFAAGVTVLPGAQSGLG